MCYSAQILAEYKKFQRVWGSILDIDAFVKEYWSEWQRPFARLPKAFIESFAHPTTPSEQRLADLIAQEKATESQTLERELFKQKKRLADAERTLRTRTTKKAQEDQRIATNKIAWALEKLADLRRTELQPRDSRIFPGWFAPVMIVERGQRVLKMMRYQCRPDGKPASYDTKYPGTYNARRDNLEGFWKGQFGVSHGVMITERFYEHVDRIDESGIAGNTILEFRPQTDEPMLVACLWSRWSDRTGQSPDLLSFAAITDDPPAEIAATGHDRCIIPIRPEHLDAWLTPERGNLAASYAILDDRQRPYFEHRMAA
jgi:putative SOS response-associated peptidase YedK